MEKQYKKRLEKLFFYSPYCFLRSIPAEKQIEKIIRPLIFDFTKKLDNQIIKIEIEEKNFYFFLSFLSWDSIFFQIPTYKLLTVLYDPSDLRHLELACKKFLAVLQKRQTNFYLWSEIPAEDSQVAQALNLSGFKLIETRLHFFKDQVQTFDYERFSVRKAKDKDILNLRHVAANARNPYDRVHADPFFSQEIADSYLAQYAENCVKGFVETVIIPDDQNKPDAFLAISKTESLETRFARIVLTAVLPSRKGWHLKLCAETVQYAKNQACDYVLMTTQATNGAVFRTCEKLGFQLGGCSQVYSWHA